MCLLCCVGPPAPGPLVAERHEDRGQRVCHMFNVRTSVRRGAAALPSASVRSYVPHPMPPSAPLWPPALEAGARVALVAPAGPLGDAAELARADANARAF